MRNTFDTAVRRGGYVGLRRAAQVAGIGCAGIILSIVAAVVVVISLSAWYMWRPLPYGPLTAVAPPTAAPGGTTLTGYILGTESEQFGDDTAHVLHRIDIAWGSPKVTNVSQFLLTPSAIALRRGAPLTVPHAVKLSGSRLFPRKVAVTYVATSTNVGISNLDGPTYFLSPVTRIVVDP